MAHLEVEQGLGQVVGVLVVLMPRAAGARLGRPAAWASLPPALLRLCLGEPCCYMPGLQLSLLHLYFLGVMGGAHGSRRRKHVWKRSGVQSPASCSAAHLAAAKRPLSFRSSIARRSSARRCVTASMHALIAVARQPSQASRHH